MSHTLKNPSRLFLVLLSLMLASCLDNSTDSVSERTNILEEIESANGFNTFVDLLNETELDSLVANTGPYTVFVPTDEAFSDLPEGLLESFSQEELKEILSYHMINGIINLNNFSAIETLPSRQGENIYFHLTTDSVYVNNHPLLGASGASNGSIYSTTGVSFPNSYLNTAALIAKRYELNTLDSLMTASGLATELEDDSREYTVFAPADTAVNDIQLPGDQEKLREILEFHVVPQKYLIGDFSGTQTLQTLSGEELTVEVDGNAIIVDGEAYILIGNIEGTNGVVHIISRFLDNRKG